MKKLLASAAVATTLIGGSAAGLALMGSSAASADTNSSTSTTATAATTTRPAPWADALKSLVTKGTITQAQADAVSQALEQSRPADGGRGHGGPGLSVAASTIGIDESALRTALQSGQSIAQVAAAHNVGVQKVIDAMTADMATHLASDVSGGKLTQAQADQMKANATQRITDMVNGTAPAGGPGGHPGDMGPGPDAGAPAAAAPTTTAA